MAKNLFQIISGSYSKPSKFLVRSLSKIHHETTKKKKKSLRRELLQMVCSSCLILHVLLRQRAAGENWKP